MLTRKINKQYVIYLSVVTALFLIDRYAKQFVAANDGFFIFPHIFGFALSRNAGIAISLPVAPIISAPLSVALIAYLVWARFSRVASRIWDWGFGLLLGGGLSNLYDRLINGFVIDYAFFQLGFVHFAFNLADCAIVIGVCMIMLEKRRWQKTGEDEFSRRMIERNQKTYDSIADLFAKTREKPLWEEVYPFKFYVHKGDRVIDIGCGNGRLLSLFGGMNVNYTGVDSSASLLECARKRKEIALEGDRGDRAFVHASMRAMPFSDGLFDCAFMIASLHHIPPRYQLSVMQETRRVLGPGGVLCMTNFNLLRLSFKGKTAWHYRAFPHIITSWHGHPLYYYAFVLSELKQLCRAAGFIVLEAYYASHGARAHIWNGRNLVVIAKK